MARPQNAARIAMEALQNHLNQPNNAVREAMALLQRKGEMPYRNALDSIREMQKSTMLPHDRLMELSRSTAAVSALAFDKVYLKGFSNVVAPTMRAIQDLSAQIGRSQLDQIAKVGREAVRRQAELSAKDNRDLPLRSNWR